MNYRIYRILFSLILIILFLPGISFALSSRGELVDYYLLDLGQSIAAGIKNEGLPYLYDQKNHNRRRGVIMAHGFSAYPTELKKLAKFLADRGFVVYGVRLAGHGISPEAMMHTTREDWYASVEDVYNVMKKSIPKIYVVGASMGGNLALKLAAEKNLYGVVTVSAPVGLQDERVKWAQKAIPIANFLRINIGYEYWGEKWVKKKNYEKYPRASVYELLELIDEVKADLPKVTEPVLVLQGKNDDTVVPNSAEYIYSNLGSEIKYLHYVDAGHVDYVYKWNKPIYYKILRFLKR